MLTPSSRINKYIRHLLKEREPFVLATREHPTDPFKPMQTIFTDRFIMLDLTGRMIPALPYSDSREPSAYRFCWMHGSESVKKMTAEYVFKLWDEWTTTPEDECIPLEVTDTLEVIDGILPVHLLRGAASVTAEQIAQHSKKSPTALREDGTLMLSRTYVRMLATDLRELQRCTFSLDAHERIVIRGVYSGADENKTPLAVVMPLAKFSAPVSRATAGGTVGIVE